jgi:hypothetical protein
MIRSLVHQRRFSSFLVKKKASGGDDARQTPFCLRSEPIEPNAGRAAMP